MRSVIINTLSLGLSASACTFTLTAHGPGSANGVIGQLDDGQNRIGGGHPVGIFSFRRPGGAIDGKGRGCILTPPTTQWQCDAGVGPTIGFTIGCDGTYYHSGSPKFHACPVNDHGEWNIYTTPVTGQDKCVEIKLTAHGSCVKPCQDKPTPPPVDHNVCSHPEGDCRPAACHEGEKPCTTSSPPVHPQPPVRPSPPPHPSQDCDHKDGEKGKDRCGQPASCPLDLGGRFEFPHLIVPVNQYSPDRAYGNHFNGIVNHHVCTTFNFDIHPDHAGKTCSLVFLFPEKKDLETSSYTLQGEGALVFNKLTKPVTEDTTWNNKGASEHLSTQNIVPGSRYLVWTGQCEAGQRVGYEICSVGSLDLNYFQDWNPSPIGLYLRQC